MTKFKKGDRVSILSTHPVWMYHYVKGTVNCIVGSLYGDYSTEYVDITLDHALYGGAKNLTVDTAYLALVDSGCKHEYVNMGFNTIKMICKHCNKELPNETVPDRNNP